MNLPSGVEATTATVCGIHVFQLTPSPGPHLPRTILLLHGWMKTHADMTLLAHRLADRGYKVIVPDLPYHGKSIAVQPCSLLETAKLLAQALVELLAASSERPQDIAVVGYSLGGRLALELGYILKRDDTLSLRLRAIAVVSAAAPPATTTECTVREVSQNRISESLLNVPGTKEGLATWLSESWYTASMWGGLLEHKDFDGMVSRIAEGFNEIRRESWAKAAISLSKYEPHRNFPAFNIPAVYVYGQRDSKYAKMSSRMTRILQNCHVLSVEGAGHNVFVQNPRVVIHSLVEFMLKEYTVLRCKMAVTLQAIKIFRYTLPMKSPIIVGGDRVVSREGFIVGVISSNGIMGIGDICPLPGLHTEDVQVCLAEIKRVATSLKKQEVRICFECFSFDCLDSIAQDISRVSRNGIDCAITHLLSKCGRMDFYSFLIRVAKTCFSVSEPMRTCAVRLNGVLPRMDRPTVGTTGISIQQNVMRFLKMNQFPVLKLKVGSLENIRQEGEEVRACVKKVKDAGRSIRLDANKSWSVTQFEDFRTALHSEVRDIDFIEEPFRDMKELMCFLRENNGDEGIGIALDESLSNSSLDDVEAMASSSVCRALVIKPSVIGSLFQVLDLVRVAVLSGCTPIFSTVFDSGVGLAWTALLAAMSSQEDVCHGLGTFQYIQRDVNVPSFESFCVQRTGLEICIANCERFLELVVVRVAKEGIELDLNLEG